MNISISYHRKFHCVIQRVSFPINCKYYHHAMLTSLTTSSSRKEKFYPLDFWTHESFRLNKIKQLINAVHILSTSNLKEFFSYSPHLHILKEEKIKEKRTNSQLKLASFKVWGIVQSFLKRACNPVVMTSLYPSNLINYSYLSHILRKSYKDLVMPLKLFRYQHQVSKHTFV